MTPRMNKHRRKWPWGVLLAILLASILGNWIGKQTILYAAIDIVGEMFLNALTLVVVPLVSSSIITGISRVGDEKGFGRLGGKMLLFYFSTSLLAIFIGLFFVNALHPGNEQIAAAFDSTSNVAALKDSISI